MEMSEFQLLNSATDVQIRAAHEAVKKSTWAYYSSFADSETTIIEAAVDASTIDKGQGEVKRLKQFLAEEVARL